MLKLTLCFTTILLTILVNAQSTVITADTIGIGTSTPQEKLDVAGPLRLSSGSPTDKIYAINSSGLTLESQGNLYGAVRLTLQNIGGSNGALFEIPDASSPQLVDFGFKTSTAQRNIRFETRSIGTFLDGGLPEFQFGTAGIPNFVVSDNIAAIKYGSSFGIGTFSPVANLDVNGTLRIADGSQQTGKVLTCGDNGIASWQPAAGTGLVSSQWITSGSNIYYPTGKVGIGTTNLNDNDYKLFVESGIRTRKVKVDQSNWPDFVFDSTSYQLQPLSEVENYIRKNNHLAGIPSAKEVESNGVDVGDNQAKLLQKIEELTLYIIQQNKDIEAQNKRISDLEAKGIK